METLYCNKSYLSSARVTKIGGKSNKVSCLVVFGGNSESDSHISTTINLVIFSSSELGHKSRVMLSEDR